MFEIAATPTVEQRQIALYWADEAGKTATPAGHWLVIASDLLKEEHASLGRAAEVLVKLNIGMAESFIVGWRAKYKYNVLRPVTYVQMTMNSKWVPRVLATPPFPSYPSGHSHQSTVAGMVLESFFGSTREFTDNAHNDRGWGPRKFPSFMAAANEAGESRIYAGIHYRFDITGGQAIGRCIATQVRGLKTER
ncbi:vanadium-dependent haloperoxidase [Ottowia sp.]|uniref:vanadium-dependent haloperoxidase n=1 Tax=Ottowia sp. TaxID=1898956 RepID=UPI0025F89158|nr:vanadium-dependent haloperoxidase [Ottowia sp.]MBK6616077.1 vanadium-dependent haloperoxidase [Ottowia sp.]